MISTGPPLSPHPRFRIVNCSHVEVSWDKPYAHPDFDVENYTLTVSYTKDNRTEVYNISGDAAYPIRQFLSNGGRIPDGCENILFSVTATNAVGTSEAGVVVGGFPIGEFASKHTNTSL